MTQPSTADHLGVKRAHSARMYDYYLGGKTNYPADRTAAAKALDVNPDVVVAARQNRNFMHRATRYLTEEYGIGQFLDIGTGVPTEPNLHQVAQSFRPDARVVYVDNDPIVLTYARALLASGPQGRTEYIDADVRAPEQILARAAELLDLSRPVAVSLVALFHFVTEEDGPYELVRALLEPLASGSALVFSHGTGDFDPMGMGGVVDVYHEQGINVRLRDRAEVRAFFDDLTLLDPGVCPTHEWRPELTLDPVPPVQGMVGPEENGVWAAVGIKP